jgi:hypothetical protein
MYVMTCTFRASSRCARVIIYYIWYDLRIWTQFQMCKCYYYYYVMTLHLEHVLDVHMSDTTTNI